MAVLEENNEVVEHCENFVFQLSDLEVTQGLDMAIALMDVGEKSEIKCVARFAYGTLGLPSKNIPSMYFKLKSFYIHYLKNVSLILR